MQCKWHSIYLERYQTQVIDSLPWVRCASGNVFKNAISYSFLAKISTILILSIFCFKYELALYSLMKCDLYRTWVYLASDLWVCKTLPEAQQDIY